MADEPPLYIETFPFCDLVERALMVVAGATDEHGLRLLARAEPLRIAEEIKAMLSVVTGREIQVRRWDEITGPRLLTMQEKSLAQIFAALQSSNEASDGR